jgi:two-component system, NtrC family, response regulator AtoC
VLAGYFLKTLGATMNKNVKDLSRAARQALMSHHWPGNVRELRNVIERALILETTPQIQAASLPDFQVEARLRKAEAPHAAGDETLDQMLSDYERDLIAGTLEQNHFSLTRTAERLKISRHALRYRMQRLNIHSADGDDEATAGDESDGLKT